MNLTLFNDLIDALGKIVNGTRTLANIPKTERDNLRSTLDETYRLIDTALNMVVIRLGEILQLNAQDDFLREAAALDNYNDWMRAEREFRLCSALRVTLREMQTLAGKLTIVFSTKDWDSLLLQMQNILTTEQEVAMFIGEKFQQLASAARNAGYDDLRAQSIRDSLTSFRACLLTERQKLIRQELDLFESI